ncbi:MAG TPA: DUF47 family protein [Candidatus Thermoplasmatota archaeon]|nr:DUF47 family protein [Candidatus Thermoplasmatota archaeon]
MGLKEWIIPQDRVFYDLLERQAQHAVEAVAAYRHMLSNWEQQENERQKVAQIEDRADRISHETFEHLNRTFITPIDREDIARLVRNLDDVVDAIDDAANSIAMYHLAEVTPEMDQFAGILELQVKEVAAMIGSMRKPARMKTELPGRIVEIHRLENEADVLFNRAVSELFRGTDPLHIMKHKEVYTFLEAATDRCEDLADIMQDILRKHG